MNIKKIGMTALAASLVSVSAHASELGVSGTASINAEGYSGEGLNAGTTFSMGNAIVFSGSGELDNGLTVSLSYELDEGSKSGNTDAAFDNHSVTVSSDAMGTLKFSGHGGSTATNKFATAAGNVWDTFDGTRGMVSALGQATAGAGNDAFEYTLPSVMDGVEVFASYTPQGATGIDGGATGFGATFSGVEGLSASYAITDINGTTTGNSGEASAAVISYAMGPITATVSEHEYDVGTASDDEETSSWALSYTLTDEMSITYGTETIDGDVASTADQEYTVMSASYTAGGMTISASMKDAENVAEGTATNQDFEYWSLGASFAF